MLINFAVVERAQSEPRSEVQPKRSRRNSTTDGRKTSSGALDRSVGRATRSQSHSGPLDTSTESTKSRMKAETSNTTLETSLPSAETSTLNQSETETSEVLETSELPKRKGRKALSATVPAAPSTEKGYDYLIFIK